MPQVQGVGLGWAAEGPDPASAVIGADGPFCALGRRRLSATIAMLRLNEHISHFYATLSIKHLQNVHRAQKHTQQTQP